jgi:hypothetical protein
MTKRHRLVACVVTVALLSAAPVLAQEPGGKAATHMSEELRSTISRIVILPIAGEGGESMTGTYGKATPGLGGGMAKGSEIGNIPVEVGQVPVSVPIPILREIGMIFGGITGASKTYIQDLRDRMSRDLSREVEQPLTNTALATDVFWGLREVPTVTPKLFAVTTPIPTDTDAILYVNLNQITLNIQEDVAIVSTSATARLQKHSDGTTLYRKEVVYEDRDELKTWAKDDFALWRQYREFARHYIAREIAAELYQRVAYEHELAPGKSATLKPDKKIPWHAETRSLTPELVWTFELLGEDKDAAQGARVLWDVEIYDAHHPVYRAQQFEGMKHTVDMPLEACKTYWWSVRPTYEQEGKKRYGEWMRLATPTAKGNGNVGRDISAAHAYLQDFASLEVDCRSK